MYVCVLCVHFWIHPLKKISQAENNVAYKHAQCLFFIYTYALKIIQMISSHQHIQ